MHQLFGQHFSSKEVGAICRHFPAADGVRISSKGLADDLKKQQRTEWERIRKESIAEQRKRFSSVPGEPSKSSLDDFKFDASDEISLVQKLREVAKKYSSNPAAYSDGLRIFKAQALSPAAFRDAFHRVFSVPLTRSECGVLLGLFNDRGAGVINAQKFLNSFFKVNRNLSSHRDFSDDEIMGFLRLEDASKPLIESFNESRRRYRSPSPEVNVETVRAFDSTGTMKPSNRVILPLLLAESELRSPPIQVGHSDLNRLALKPMLAVTIRQQGTSAKLSDASPKHPSLRSQKPSDERRASVAGEINRKVFVFPALLSSAPIFTLSPNSLL